MKCNANSYLSLDKPSGPSTTCIGKSVGLYHQLRPDVKFMMPESITYPQDNSASLLEDVVAKDLSRQIGGIAETPQREGWPMPLVKRFMHRSVENLPE